MSKGIEAVEEVKSPADLAKLGFESLSQPKIFNPKNLELNKEVIDGVVTGFLPPSDKYRSPLLVMKLTKDGTELKVAAQATIHNQVFDKAGKCLVINKRIAIMKIGSKTSTWKDAETGNYREYPVYSVSVFNSKK